MRAVRRAAREFVDDSCFDLAAQLAFYFVLSLFPSLLMLLSLSSFFRLDKWTGTVTTTLSGVAAPEVVGLIQAEMERLSGAQNGGVFTLAMVGAVWSSSSALASVLSSINTAWDLIETRAWWKLRLLAFLLAIVFGVYAVCAVGLVALFNTICEHWSLEAVKHILSPFFIGLLVCLGFNLLYYFAPAEPRSLHVATPGSIAATTTWILISLVFKAYLLTSFNTYASYGAVGAVIVLLLWLYVTALALLYGAELDAELSRVAKDHPEMEHGIGFWLGVRACP